MDGVTTDAAYLVFRGGAAAQESREHQGDHEEHDEGKADQDDDSNHGLLRRRVLSFDHGQW